MKLLIAIPYFMPYSGGMEKHTYTIARGLIENYGYQIVVITANHEEKVYKVETLEGIKVYRLPYQFKISNTPVNIKWKRQIRKIIEEEKPDVINGRGPVPFISDIACQLAKEMKITFILGWHFPTMKKGDIFLDPMIFLYEHFFLQRMLANSKKIICTSDYIRDSLLKKYQHKTTVITQGIDETLFRVKNVSKIPYSIIFVGNLETKVKGLDYLLYAVKMLANEFPKITLNVIGGGETSEYKEKCIDLGIGQNVYFKGVLSGERLVDEYNESEVFACPSTSENFPSTMIEAMFCQVPVVVSGIGNIPYFVKNNINGIVVHPRNVPDLAAGIKELFINPWQSKVIAINGRKSVSKKFNWEEKIKKTHEVIGEALLS